MDHAGDVRLHSTPFTVADPSRRDADAARRRAQHDAAVEARQRLFMAHITASNPDSWLYTGASMMRASLAVQRQLLIDARTAVTAKRAGGRLIRPLRARVHKPAVLLAALGLENALKGAIVARSPLLPSGGKLCGSIRPGLATGQNLAQLARQAGVKAVNAEETHALEAGHLDIEDPGRFWPAYRALFLRAVDAAARAVWDRHEDLQRTPRKAYAAEEVATHRMFIEGVYSPASGEEALDLF